MNKTKKVKITLGLFYLIVVASFLYFFLSKFTLEELTSYEFIKNNRDYFLSLKKNDLFSLSVVFLISTIFWVLMGGFGSPVALLGGFIFGKWLGLLIVILGMSFGATILYVMANYFFKDLVSEKFLPKFKNLEIKFKKSEFLYLLVYRFIGGIPFAFSNILPCIFNVKISYFFWATLLGIMPQIFLITSIGDGLENVIQQNLETPNFKDLIFAPEIYKPTIAFFLLVVISIFLRKFFYRNKIN
tara:strand:- start:827 stop:1555 length:729 start_codon:yes stop_codon:yes gene_type:complete